MDSRGWFGQPPGLTILFLTEMWEKFSFFGMRALLVYYMIKGLHFDQTKAALIYGAYSGLVYFTPIAGGAIADRWIGARRAVLAGGALMAAGHFALASPALFYPALGLIILGNGLFLPNLPSQVRGLYDKSDPRRGSAYNIYYVGINLGAFLAPLVCGTLGELLGWHYGFAAAGLGLCLGLIIYAAGTRYLPRKTRVEWAPETEPGEPGITPWHLLGAGLAVTVFRAAYEQIGNTVALFADADTNRTVGGFDIPGSWFMSLNPLLIFLLTPLVVRLWTREARRGREPASLVKMSHGALGVAGAYLLLAAVAASASGKSSWLFLVAFNVALTAGELFILPVGLGLFARAAPPGRGATLVAAWFAASFAGNFLAGSLATLWSRLDHATFFVTVAAVAALSAAALRALHRGAAPTLRSRTA